METNGTNGVEGGTEITIAGEAAAAQVLEAAAAQPRGSCRYCGLEGQHPEPEAMVACIVCAKAHGEAITVRDRKTEEMVERKVLVLHSLGDNGSRDRVAVVREGGRKDDGAFVDPRAPWTTQPICMGCCADLKCATYEVRKAAQRDGAKHHELPRWPVFWALHLAVEEAAHRNRVETEDAAQEKTWRAEEDKRRARIAHFVAKGYHVSRPSGGGDSHRDDRGRGRGDRRGNRDGNGQRGRRAGRATHEGPTNGVVTSVTGANVYIGG